MAEGKLVTREPILHINDEEDGENAVEFVNVFLAYLETRANHTKDGRIDGVQLSDELHRAAADLRSAQGQRYDGRRAGHELARCDVSAEPREETDAATSRPGEEKREVIQGILRPFVEGAYEQGGRLLEDYLRKKMCNKSGIGV